MTTEYEQCTRRFLLAMTSDYAGIWQLLTYLRPSASDQSSGSNENHLRAAAMSCLRDVLERDLVEAGAATSDGGFVPWDLPPEAAVARIEREWEELGRTPTIGELAWFRLTDVGRNELSSTIGNRSSEH